MGNQETSEDLEIKKGIMDMIVPVEKVTDETHMNRIRKWRTLNLDIPGCIELEDPNRFLEKLRPIEDFRHTPIIPIEESAMKRF